jgi:5-methylthioadenosine/S-adenosylhomocysteine deaminase
VLIRNATVLSMDPDVGDLSGGDVLIEQDRITAVGYEIRSVEPTDEVDATGCIVIPGFIDTHRHMWQGALRGLAPQDSLKDYFRRVVQGIGPTLSAAWARR